MLSIVAAAPAMSAESAEGIDSEAEAKIIHAEGEEQAAAALGRAATQIGEHPVTIQLRYLQTLTELATEKNSTVIVPVPIDWMKALIEKSGGGV